MYTHSVQITISKLRNKFKVPVAIYYFMGKMWYTCIPYELPLASYFTLPEAIHSVYKYVRDCF